MEKLSKYTNIFFVLCALQPDNKFDFFKLPIEMVREYFREKGTQDSWLGIERVDKRKYELRPYRLAKLFDINEYLL